MHDKNFSFLDNGSFELALLLVFLVGQSRLISNTSQVIGEALDNGGGLGSLDGCLVLCDEDGLLGSRKDRSVTLGRMEGGRSRK
jgi:hypothetical protein